MFKTPENLQTVPDYKCPACGAWSCEETLVTRMEYDVVETPFGDAMIWTEVHKCYCGRFYSFRNSNV